MNKPAFIQHLRDTADVLKPLTIQSSPGAKHWNGTAYVEAEPAQFDPGALAWWSTLTAVAEMIDNQDAPVSERQAAYLDGLLFGAMGSLNDLSISSQQDRKTSDSINASWTANDGGCSKALRADSVIMGSINNARRCR
jgi:hypothetical protein